MILSNKNNKILSLKNYRYKEAVPFAVYAGFECLLEPTGDESRVQKHIPYYLKCAFDDTLSKFAIKHRPDCIEWFIDQLLEIAKTVNSYLTKIVPMSPLTSDENRGFDNATDCHICEKPFIPTGSNIVTIAILLASIAVPRMKGVI